VSLLLGIVIGGLLWRWWRKHRKQIQRWWQKHEERLPQKWHPKSEKACSHCQAGVQVSIARVNQAVTPYCSQKQKKEPINVFQRTGMPVLVGRAPILA